MRRFFLLSFISLTFISIVFAQPVDDELPQITGCITLVNAKVVSAPGKSPETSTIIIRDGLIIQVGANLKIPADAYRIQADSLYVYPAFIDAFSSIGIKEQESESNSNQGPGNRGQGQKPIVDAEGNTSLEEAGITPFKSVRSTFDPKEKSISEWRAQGFAIAHVVPKGKMIPGMGSVVVLSGKDADQMLWKEDVSMFSQWTGSGGSYPSTVIGVMAKWRELYHNAAQNVIHESAYENATLVSRPKYNQAHEALMPVVKKEMAVYFRAPKIKDISRALAMQKDLGMKMVITDAEEAWYLKDQFKSSGTPLVLSLDLPEDKSKKPDASADKAAAPKDASAEKPTAPKDASAEKDTTSKDASVEKATASKEDPKTDTSAVKTDTVALDPEQIAFEKRRAESLKAHREQASFLSKEGIPFSFGTMSVKSSDFVKNIQTIIENGLSFDNTLAALTTKPASLLGIEKYCGTVEAGKMANIIVSTKPLFEKDAAVRYMIVEGNLYEYEVKEKKKSSGKESPGVVAKIEGTWAYTIETPDQKREGTFEFTGSGGELKGTMSSTDITSGNNQLESIVLEGNSASFTFDFDMGGQMMVLEFDLKLDGDLFEGTVSVGEFGSFPIAGHRTSKPN